MVATGPGGRSRKDSSSLPWSSPVLRVLRLLPTTISDLTCQCHGAAVTAVLALLNFRVEGPGPAGQSAVANCGVQWPAGLLAADRYHATASDSPGRARLRVEAGQPDSEPQACGRDSDGGF